MEPKTLRVRASGIGHVQDLEALNASPRRYIGLEWAVVDGRYGTKPSGKAVEVPNRAEYRACVKEGALIACDDETAKTCGVPFEAVAEIQDSKK